MATIDRNRQVNPETIRSYAGFIWQVADLLRGDYKRSEYGRVILPMVVLRRLDCVLERTKAAVRERAHQLAGQIENVDPVLEKVARHSFYNTSPLDLRRLLDDPATIADQFRQYISEFSPSAREVIEKFAFDVHIARLERANLLFLVISKFTEIDLHPEVVSNIEMGYIYEELIRLASEASNETAGEHFTPREVIRLMVNLLFIEDDETILTRRGIVKTLYDPACGTGGMLSVAEEHLRNHHEQADLKVFGQELNAETYATCRADMLLKGQDPGRIKWGNSFTEDGHEDQTFDYMLANPPFGVEWKKVEEKIRGEAEKKGFSGRFGAGLPRINDGSFLFLQHMISKMKRVEEGGSRLAIVFNGSPLFTGAAGSGESEIRRWIIENDWLEAIVALPDQLFYNTGISTYFWVVTNRKSAARRGKVQLVDAREMYVKMRKSLGEKRKEISAAQIAEITRLYGDFEDGERVKILPNEAFGFMRITVERPLRLRWEVTDETIAAVHRQKPIAKLEAHEWEALSAALRKHFGLSTTDRRGAVRKLDTELRRLDLGAPVQKAVWTGLAVRDEDAPSVTDAKGNPQPDPELRDSENVPLPLQAVTFAPDVMDRLANLAYRTTIDDYIRTQVCPYVPDAWVDYETTKIGYEMPLTRLFYKYAPPRPLGRYRCGDQGVGSGHPRVAGRSSPMRSPAWTTIPAKYLYTIVDRRAADADDRTRPLLSVSIHAGVVP
jgi:type I restriction enzyme M protein